MVKYITLVFANEIFYYHVFPHQSNYFKCTFSVVHLIHVHVSMNIISISESAKYCTHMYTVHVSVFQSFRGVSNRRVNRSGSKGDAIAIAEAYRKE